MITRCRLPFRFDPDRLRAELQLLERQPWIRHYVSENFRGEWSALPLRAIAGQEGNIYAHPEPAAVFSDTAALATCSYLREVLATFQCPLSSVRLMKLGPGSEILEHTDPGTGYEYGELRLHVPVTTSPEVSFFLDGHRVEMQAGECWYLNFQLPHRVVNASSTERVHLVIDCTLNPWFDAIFRDQGFSVIEQHGTRAWMLDNHIAGLRQLGTPEALQALKKSLEQKAELETALRARQLAPPRARLRSS